MFHLDLSRLLLVSRLFAAALDPAEWQGVVEGFADVLDGAKVHLAAMDVHRGFDLGLLHTRHDDVYIDAYKAHLATVNPYPVPALQKAGPANPTEWNAIIPFEEVRHTEFYNEFMAPQERCENGIGIILDVRDSATFILGAMHPARYRDRLDRDGLALFRSLRTDLRSAWLLSRRGAEAGLRAGLDGGPTAMLCVIDAAGFPIYLDAGAREAVERGTWLASDGRGRIRLVDPATQLRLAGFLMQVNGGLAHAFTVEVTGEEGTAEVLVAPMHSDIVGGSTVGLALGLNRPGALVSIRVRPLPPDDPVARIATALNLSTAEAEVALALSEGRAPGEIAEMRQVRLVTVRNQIKSALARAGMQRQSQLAAAAARIAVSRRA